MTKWAFCARPISTRTQTTAITARTSCRPSAGSQPCGIWASRLPMCAGCRSSAGTRRRSRPSSPPAAASCRPRPRRPRSSCCFWTQPKNGWERKILCSTISPSRPFRRAMPPVSIPSSRAIRTKARSGRRSAPRPTTCTSSRTTPATARSPSSTGNSRRPTWSSRRGRPSRARTPTRRT